MASRVEIRVPRLGLSVTEVSITEWLFEAGESVREGEPICLAESDKITFEIEAPVSGILSPAAAVDEVCEVGAAIGAVVVD